MNSGNNRNFSVEQTVRNIVRDELARSFGLTIGGAEGTNFSEANGNEAESTREARSRAGQRGGASRAPGKGRVTDPRADKRLKRNRAANA